MKNLFSYIKGIIKKFTIRFRKKDSDKDIDKVIKVEDYGEYNIQIVYTNDYINKYMESSIMKFIKPHVVFLIQLPLDKKDIIDDYFEKLLPFININIKNPKYIISIKDNTLYSYISLNNTELEIIFREYYSSVDPISFILSKIVTLFNEELNNVMYEKYIPESDLNYVDTLPHYKNIFRTYKNSCNNIVYIDDIPNVVDHNGEKVFTMNQLLTLINIFFIIDPEYPVRDIEGYVEDTFEYSILGFLKHALCSENNISFYRHILYQLENDSYCYIYGKNLLKYIQQSKLIRDNIHNEDSGYYDDIDEVL